MFLKAPDFVGGHGWHSSGTQWKVEGAAAPILTRWGWMSMDGWTTICFRGCHSNPQMNKMAHSPVWRVPLSGSKIGPLCIHHNSRLSNLATIYVWNTIKDWIHSRFCLYTYEIDVVVAMTLLQSSTLRVEGDVCHSVVSTRITSFNGSAAVKIFIFRN